MAEIQITIKDSLVEDFKRVTNQFEREVNMNSEEYKKLRQRYLHSIDVAESTLNIYRKALWAFMKWREEQAYTGKIDRAQVKEYRAWLRTKRAAGTVRMYFGTVKRFLQWCVDEGYLLRNPAQGLKSAKVSQGHTRANLTKEEIQKLFNIVDTGTLIGKRDLLIISLKARCGLRDIEIMRSNLSDLEERDGHLLLWVQGKGRDAKNDYVVLPEPAKEALYDYLEARKGAINSNALFVSLAQRNYGKRMTSRSVRRQVNRYLKEAGLKSDKITPHSLRHSFVTLAIESGIPIHKVQHAARHRSIATTQIYYHENNRLKEPVEEQINW